LTRAVLFDVDGVLVHSLFHADPSRRRRWDEHLLEDMGVDPKAFSALFDEKFLPTITGNVSLVETLDAFLPGIGYTGSTLDFVGYWLARDVHVDYRLFEGIKALRASGGVRLYLATNQEHLRANYLWSQLNLGHVFDDMYYAARLGAAKPDPRFFAAITERLGPQETPPLFFDDAPRVIEAARAFGWEAVLFTEAEDFLSQPFVAERLARGAA
jgi:putative hydrolase of the HAD superfamily